MQNCVSVSSLEEMKEREGEKRGKGSEEEGTMGAFLSVDNPKAGPTANSLNPSCFLHYLQFPHGFKIVFLCPDTNVATPASKDRKLGK